MNEFNDFVWPIAAALGYIIGAIPFGLIFARLAGYGDLREIGSGNIGATNALRTGSRLLGAATLLADAGKGFVAVLIGVEVAGELGGLSAAAGSFLGHLYPIWLGFKGGKGIAVLIGVLLALSPMTGIAFCLVWLLVGAISRRSSFAAIAACLVAPLVPFLLLGEYPVALLAAFCAVLALWAHRGNIRRLRDGSEPSIGH